MSCEGISAGKRWLGAVLCAAALGTASAGSAEDRPAGASEVLVVFNSSLRESRDVARYYARKRRIPEERVLGLKLPQTETISRKQFDEQLSSPLLREIESRRLMTFHAEIVPATSEAPGKVLFRPVEAKIRYLVLCYGVPLKIAPEPSLVEKGASEVRAELRRNEAAVDSELALLPLSRSERRLFGPIPNRLYGATNAAMLNPLNGILMVARLDGPAASIARGLVDKAIEAEETALQGRAYFDARGIAEGAYRVGDEWIKGAADAARRSGFETVLDDAAATFSTAFPMSHIAIYAGWYDGSVSGPFLSREVDFMPGAIAYHLHSFSAATLRSATANWVGPLLARGATASMGAVFEPYLEGTPDLRVFFSRLLGAGYTFGEAAYAAQTVLSWQVTVVGDPLYRPVSRTLREQHQFLLARGGSGSEWTHLKIVNVNLARGDSPASMIAYLQEQPVLGRSAVLLEKLAVMQAEVGDLDGAIASYERAYREAKSKPQRLRLLLDRAASERRAGKPEKTFATYQEFVRRFEDYPDLVTIYERLAALAGELGRAADRERYQKEIERRRPKGSA